MMGGKMDIGYYAEDAISLPNNQPIIRGKQAIKQNFDQAIQAGVKFDSFVSTPTDVIIDGKTIVEVGTYVLKASVPGAPIEDKGKYATVWEIQKDGSYKIKVETWNTDISPQMWDPTKKQNGAWNSPFWQN